MTGEPVELTILLVDDEEELLFSSRLILKRAGFAKVLTQSDSRNVMAMLEKQPVDLVLLDMTMPYLSGRELLELIKTAYPEIRVVMVTAVNDLETAVNCMQAGADNYLVKPVESERLISVVHQTTEKIRLVQENRSLVEQLKEANSALRVANEALSQQALRDGMTGLYNYRFFQEAFAKELARSKRQKIHCSLLFIDVDHFKTFNDTNGHPMGDTLLKTLADLFLSKFRESDMVARYGGEEFVAILTKTSREGALLVAEQIRQKIETHPFAGRENMPAGKVTASMGVATFPDDGEDATALLSHADQALYRAKHDGRNKVC